MATASSARAATHASAAARRGSTHAMRARGGAPRVVARVAGTVLGIWAMAHLARATSRAFAPTLNAHRDRSGRCEETPGKWDVDAARARARALTAESEAMRADGFAVLLNTFERPDLLKTALRHYGKCRGVVEIRVVWSEKRDAPREGTAEDGYFVKKKPGLVRYDAHAESTSIQNRFEPLDDLRTRAVFNVDEDVRIPCETLYRGFKAWQKHPDALVGYYARNYAPAKKPSDGCSWRYVANEFQLWWSGKYSIILTKAAFMDQKYLKLYKEHLPDGVREYIDKGGGNCEDIAMQFLISSITREAPVYVPASLMYYTKAKLGGVGVAGISSGAGHHLKRGDCITDFQTMFGAEHIPLVETYQ
jgi:hypothetical protein